MNHSQSRQVQIMGKAGMRRATRENFEYLVRTLSGRTAGKKYENYVVNAIWNALGDETLRPVAQQYVNRRVHHRGLALVDLKQERATGESAGRAQIDLYFPALRLGVECDEGQHHDPSTADADRARTADIKRAIPDYEELRVRVELDENRVAISPEAVLDQIDDVVARIRQRKARVERGDFPWARSGTLSWRSEVADWQLALEVGEIRAGDGYLFAQNGEIRELFGLGDGTGTKYSNFKTNIELHQSKYIVWCPTLATQADDGTIASTNQRGYLNWIFVEGDTVLLGQADPTSSEKPWVYSLPEGELSRRARISDWKPPEPDESDANPWGSRTRITFVRTRDATGRKGFQFLGLFTPPIGYRLIDGVSFEVCRLISDTLDLRRV
jgi:very-short-patch-repair endonuclease